MVPSPNQIKYFRSLHAEALGVCRNLEREEYRLIEILQKIDREKVYRCLGYKSLIQYAMIGLKLSKDRAYNFITVARKASEVDRLQVALKENKITLSKAKRISSVLTKDNADHWLKLSHDLSQRLLERAVARVNPRSAVEEGSRFISETTLELRAAISEETDEILRRVQDVLCQSQGKAVSMDEALKTACKLFLEKNDPVIKASRILKREIKKDSSQRRVNQEDKTQGPLLQITKHNINFRDQGQCKAKNPDGSTCNDSRWVDIHHRIPRSEGGLNTIENLMTLCKAHHQLEHHLSG